MAEQLTFNEQVMGSNPMRPTTLVFPTLFSRATRPQNLWRGIFLKAKAAPNLEGGLQSEITRD